MNYKAGQRIRVSYEGVITQVYVNGVIHLDSAGTALRLNIPNGSVEILEEPVEVFGPGSVVMNVTSGRVFTVLDNAYVWNHTHQQKETTLHDIDSSFYVRLA